MTTFESISSVVEDEVLATVIEIVAGETLYTPHTIAILNQLRAVYPALEPTQMMRSVEKAQFFKPEGLVKVARGIGFGSKEMEALEIRLGFRKEKNESKVQEKNRR